MVQKKQIPMRNSLPSQGGCDSSEEDLIDGIQQKYLSDPALPLDSLKWCVV